MPARRIFTMQNNFTQRDGTVEGGICTVASLQWAKRCLQLGRGIGSYSELNLSDHMMNGLMAVWRREDGDPVAQTRGMGLRIVGADRDVTQFVEMQRHCNLTAPHVCIFWNSHHTMGYRVDTSHGREVEFFDNENGLWVADNDTDIRARIINQFNAEGYDPIEGMRIVTL